MDGLELVRRVKSSHSAIIPSIVMVTAYGVEIIKDAASQNLIDGYMLKPIHPSALYNTLNTILQEQPLPVDILSDHQTLLTTYKDLLSGYKVLVVEDNDINLELSIHLLQEVGMVTDIARNGIEAIHQVSSNKYDAVLMDIQMPEMDGLTATREIRKMERLQQLPILAMTAHAMKGEREKSMEAGMNEHINKPIDPMLLYAALLQAIKGESLQVDGSMRTSSNTSSDVFVIEGLDVADGLYRSGNKLSNYHQLLKGFAERNKNISQQGQSLIADNKVKELSSLLHLLAGVAGNLGANVIYEKAISLSHRLNESANANELESAQQQYAPVMQLLADVELLAQKIMAYLDATLETSAATRIILSDAEFAVSMSELKTLIQSNDAMAQDLCLQLSESLTEDDERRIILKNSSRALDEFEFDTALELINSI
jgi:CheY-like chemotaxis protein/HPt (histidine-containing phosphotransfer) domain-containing protein